MELILASASPRRRSLLGALGLTFSVRNADIDETPPENASPEEAAVDIALRKAKAVQQECPGDCVIIGADTTVVLGDTVLGKPADPEDAVRMLRRLSGQRNRVLTGVAVLRGERVLTACVETGVRFYPLTEEAIRAYVATGEPLDKAGAYGIQGRAALFVEGIDGDYNNVVGLPVAKLVQMLDEIGVPATETVMRRRKENV